MTSENAAVAAATDKEDFFRAAVELSQRLPSADATAVLAFLTRLWTTLGEKPRADAAWTPDPWRAVAVAIVRRYVNAVR